MKRVKLARKDRKAMEEMEKYLELKEIYAGKPGCRYGALDGHSTPFKRDTKQI